MEDLFLYYFDDNFSGLGNVLNSGSFSILGFFSYSYVLVSIYGNERKIRSILLTFMQNYHKELKKIKELHDTFFEENNITQG